MTDSPWDEAAEQSVLGAMLLSRQAVDDVSRILRASDFYRPAHSDIYVTILGLWTEGNPADAITVANALSKTRTLSGVGGPLYLHTLIQSVPTAASAEHYARIVKDKSDTRQMLATLTRGIQRLQSEAEPGGVIAEIATEIQVIEAGIDPGLTTYGFGELMATPDDRQPWVMPGMMRTGERLIVTGNEGAGKSLLMAQVCLGSAMGVNTLGLAIPRHDPMRVLVLDVENQRHQIKANARKVYPYLREITGSDGAPSIEWVDVSYLDLSDPVHQSRVVRLARDRQPQLMYMGSIYRLAPGGEKAVQQFEWITRTVDRIRAETGTAVVMEAHMGHGMQNDRNGGRPRGASEFLGWPEYGLGMIPHKASGCTELKTWRGHRSDDRQWPVALRRGHSLPWLPVSQDEWSTIE